MEYEDAGPAGPQTPGRHGRVVLFLWVMCAAALFVLLTGGSDNPEAASASGSLNGALRTDFVIEDYRVTTASNPWDEGATEVEPLLRGDFELREYERKASLEGYDPYGSIAPMDPSLPLWPNCTEIKVAVHYDYHLSWLWRPLMATEAENALGDLRRLTGLNLVLPPAGVISIVDEAPEPTPGQIDIIWVDDSLYPLAAGQVAYTNLMYVVPEDAPASITKAQVFLPASLLHALPVNQGLSSGADVRTAVLHELGHAVGLGHTTDNDHSIMATYHKDETIVQISDRVAFRNAGGRPCADLPGSGSDESAAAAPTAMLSEFLSVSAPSELRLTRHAPRTSGRAS